MRRRCLMADAAKPAIISVKWRDSNPVAGLVTKRDLRRGEAAKAKAEKEKPAGFRGRFQRA
jgi:hypothetical protein